MSVKGKCHRLLLTVISLWLLPGLESPLSAQEVAHEKESTPSENQLRELEVSLAPYLEKSIAQCREAALKQDPKAMLVLAQKLLAESKEKQNCPEAIEWLTKAADMNFVPAVHRLGVCHYYAVGTTEDDSKAFACFRRAAAAGFISSQHKLGMCYHFGQGVGQDSGRAFDLFRESGEAGELESIYVVGVYFKEGSAVPRDDAEAARWWKKAADRGHLLACNNLGIAYLEGNGVETDKQHAIMLFREGAVKGNSYCQYNLGRCYRDGIGVIQNFDTAEEWLNKAAEQKHDVAVEALAHLRSARANAVRILNSRPGFPGSSNDAEEAARRQIRDYQIQLGNTLQ